MTQDNRTSPRMPDADTEGWSPFGGPVHGTASQDETQDADLRPSTVRLDAPSWRPRVIEGGRGHEDMPGQDATADEDIAAGEVPAGKDADVLDAAAADVLAILDAPPAVDTKPTPEVVELEPTAAPTPEPVEETPASALAAPAAAPEPPVEIPAAPTQEPTPHPTLHTLTQATPETSAPARDPAETVETPHTTPWLRTAVGWLNPYEVLDQPLPPVSAIYDAARSSVTDRSGFDRATEIGWVYAIGMPITVACYTLAAAVQRKMRGIGVALTVLLWTAAANTAPVDTSLVWTWTAIGYWVSTAFVLPAVIQAKK